MGPAEEGSTTVATDPAIVDAVLVRRLAQTNGTEELAGFGHQRLHPDRRFHPD